MIIKKFQQEIFIHVKDFRVTESDKLHIEKHLLSIYYIIGIPIYTTHKVLSSNL